MGSFSWPLTLTPADMLKGYLLADMEGFAAV
jgi:hypothetical protein